MLPGTSHAATTPDSGMKIIRCACALAIGAWLPASASAQALPTYPITDGAANQTTWAVDRYRPAVFVNAGTVAGRENVLRLGVAEADGPGNRPAAQSSSFFNTQGRRLRLLDWTSRPYSLVGSTRIPAAWASSTGLADSRRTDLWTVLTDVGVQDVSRAVFGIIGFTNEGAPPAGYRQPAERAHMPPEYMPEGGGSGRYRVFDSHAGGWQDLPAPVRYDTWSDFCVTYTGSTLEYRIGNELVYTDNTLTFTVGGVTTAVAGVMEIIMQAQNYGQRPVPPGGIAGVTYDTNWSSLAAGPGDCSAVLIGSGHAADLRVTKSATPASVNVGGTVQFRIEVVNLGPSLASGVVAVDDLPGGVTYLANSCGASFANPRLNWTIGDMAVGSSASCDVAVRVDEPGTIVNSVVVSGVQIDPVTANNQAQAQLAASAASPVSVPTLQFWAWIALGLGVLATASGVLMRRAG